jgi:flagellar hook-basal body complex protein FliE
VAGPVIAANPAIAAYAEATKRAAGKGIEGDTPLPSFGQLVQQSMTDAVAAGHKSEAASLQAASGRASLQDVVEAVNAAELSLQTVVSIRDRVISAYQEIMRMPIGACARPPT